MLFDIDFETSLQYLNMPPACPGLGWSAGVRTSRASSCRAVEVPRGVEVRLRRVRVYARRGGRCTEPLLVRL